MASENHYTTAGTVLSGFEHSTTYDQTYQTLPSAAIQSLERLLIEAYLETKTDASYRRRVQTYPCRTCTAVTTCLDAGQIRIVDYHRHVLSTTDVHHNLDYVALSASSNYTTLYASKSLEPHYLYKQLLQPLRVFRLPRCSSQHRRQLPLGCQVQLKYRLWHIHLS